MRNHFRTLVATGGLVAVALISLGTDLGAAADTPVGTVERRVALGPVSAVAYAGSGVWVARAGRRRGSLRRLAPTSLRTTDRIAIGAVPADLEADGRALYVVNARGDAVTSRYRRSTLLRVDTRTRRAVSSVRVAQPDRVAAAGGRAWIVSAATSRLTSIDVRTGRVRSRIGLLGTPRHVETSGRWIWVAGETVERGSPPEGVLWRIDASSMRIIGRTRLPALPGVVRAVGAGVWVASGRGLERVDAQGRLSEPVRVSSVTDFVVGHGRVWVTGPVGRVTRVSYGGVVEGSVRVGETADYLAYGGGRVWVISASDGRLVVIRPA